MKSQTTNADRAMRLAELQAKVAEAEQLLTAAHELHMRLLHQDQEVIGRAIQISAILGKLDEEIRRFGPVAELPN